MGMNKDNTDAAIAKTESKTLKSQMSDIKNKLRNVEAEVNPFVTLRTHSA